jgi:hypothetical protein
MRNKQLVAPTDPYPTAMCKGGMLVLLVVACKRVDLSGALLSCVVKMVCKISEIVFGGQDEERLLFC